MKRIVSLMLALTLFFSTGLSVSFAASWKYGSGKKIPPGLAKKGFLHSGIAKKFQDIDGYEWAERAIEKMAIKGVIKGYGKGKFAPQKPVTKLEAIIMALRVMGYEKEAKLNFEKIKKGAKKLKHKDFVQDWAYGYVSVALEKGILDEIDLLDFNLNEPAKRHEVAKYIIRALGLEEEAQEHMKEDLRFIDKAAIPLGAVGYIYISDEKGIIKGYPDGTFLPNRHVTRAEMALLIARLDDKVESDIDVNEKYGEIVKVNEEKLTLKVKDEFKTYYILENVPVYNLDGKYVSIDELSVGMKVKVQLNDEGTIIFIEIKDREEEKLIDEYEGKVVDIGDESLSLKVDNIKLTFEIDNDVEVEFENKEGKFEDIKIGDEVKVKVNEDNEIRYIEVDRELELESTEYEGTVVENVYEEYSLTLDIENIKMTFDVDEDVAVVFEDEIEGDLKDIVEGDEVKIKVNDKNEIEHIKVDRSLDFITVQLVDIYEEANQIVVKDNTTFKIYNLDNNVIVLLNGEKADLSDLKTGDKLKLKFENDKIIEIRGYRIIIES